MALTVMTRESNVIKIIIIINKNKSIIEKYTRYNSKKETWNTKGKTIRQEEYLWGKKKEEYVWKMLAKKDNMIHNCVFLLLFAITKPCRHKSLSILLPLQKGF